MVQLFPAMPWDHSLFPRGLIGLTALSSLPPLLNNSLAAQKFPLHGDFYFEAKQKQVLKSLYFPCSIGFAEHQH